MPKGYRRRPKPASVLITPGEAGAPAMLSFSSRFGPDDLDDVRALPERHFHAVLRVWLIPAESVTDAIRHFRKLGHPVAISNTSALRSVE